MSYLVNVFLLFLLTLEETHNFVSLSEKLRQQLGFESVEPDLPLARFESVEERLQRELERARAGAEHAAPAAAGGNDTVIREEWLRMKRDAPKLVSSCYTCNCLYPNMGVQVGERLFPVSGIPNNSLCADAWDGENHSLARMRRYFRTRCFTPKHGGQGILVEPVSERDQRYDRGHMIHMYGNFSGGCVKRFLDVGKEYTGRMCRLHGPVGTTGFAGTRFVRLELLLWDQKDACVVSPHASLTPFSRGVSLFVRYHVCVCSRPYCNPAPPPPHPAGATSLLLLMFSINLI